eukprot:13309823-Heterocapsa_arctica.AAC.1
MPDVQICKGVQHLVDALAAAQVLDEVVFLFLGHRHRDLAIFVHELHARVKLEIAPHPRDVLRILPRGHQCHDAADAGDAVAEG